MKPLTTYWLSRTTGAATEGPVTVGQLRRWKASGEITGESLLCRNGEEEWLRLDDELQSIEIECPPMMTKPVAAVPRQPSFEESLRRRDEYLAKRFSSAVNWMAGLTCLIALVPGLGFVGGIVAYGLLLSVGTILCVLTMVKGRVGRGIMDLIGIWILVPLVMVAFQAFGLGVFSGWSEKKIADLKQANASKPAAKVFTEPTTNDPFEKMAISDVKRRASPRFIYRVRSSGDALQKQVWVEFQRTNGPHVWRMTYKGSELQSIYSDREGDLAP